MRFLPISFERIVERSFDGISISDKSVAERRRRIGFGVGVRWGLVGVGIRESLCGREVGWREVGMR